MVSDTKLAEAEEIGKDLESRKPQVSHDAPDIFFLHQLLDTQPDLVPRAPHDYFVYYELYLQKEEGYTSTRAIAKTVGLKSHGSLKRPFDKIKDAIAEMRKGSSVTVVEELPALDSLRLAELYKKGKMVQLDPRALLPPEDHKHYKISRYFQKRRGPRVHPVDVLAESIGTMGMIEPGTVQAAGSHNGFVQRIMDGFNRSEAWIIADEKAGGTDKKPVLEYPVYLVIDCTNAEGDLIALEKNRNKDNFDRGDRDYSIVTMYERHPEVYTQKKLCELNNLDKSTMSNIISAWRESWPCDAKKGETPENNPVRKALEERQITTYHARLLAKLKKWPSEQKRIAKWLLTEVDRYQRSDAHYQEFQTISESDGHYFTVSFDNQGLSSGNLMKMVRTAVENMEHADAVEKDVTKLLKEGKIDEKVSPAEVIDLQTKFTKERKKGYGPIPKTYIEKGLRAAGVKISTVKPDAESMKPTSPATAGAKAVKQTPVLVCKNCELYFDPGTNSDMKSRCMISIEPTKENECAVQGIFPGQPTYRLANCLLCGGVTIDRFMKDLPVETGYYQTKKGKACTGHAICVMELKLKELDIKGQCQTCSRSNCDLLGVVSRGELDVEVKFCPETDRWYRPLPDMTIKEINKEVQARIDLIVKNARAAFEKTEAKAAKVAGRTD